MIFVASRLARTLFLAWLVASIVFLVLHLVPGDPGRASALRRRRDT